MFGTDWGTKSTPIRESMALQTSLSIDNLAGNAQLQGFNPGTLSLQSIILGATFPTDPQHGAMLSRWLRTNSMQPPDRIVPELSDSLHVLSP